VLVRRCVIVAALALTGTTLASAPAHAGHDHFIVTPTGMCHQVARGQTSLAEGHGGHHRFHHNVHLDATESTTAPDTLGDGNSRVSVYKAGCP
jgi:Spy/CpxP family protein refolding chaperone